MILSLMNLIAREGMTETSSNKLIGLVDTLLTIDDYNACEINMVSVEALLLLLVDFDIKPTAKRLTEELRHKIVRIFLGNFWTHGVAVKNYTLSEMNRNVVTEEATIMVFEDGATHKEILYSVQPIGPKDELLLNDYGRLALN